MKKMRLILLLVFLLSTPTLAADTVRLTSLEWRPYAGSDLQNLGFSSEIIQKAFRSQGVSAEITFQPWNQAMASVKAGKFDALYSAYYTEERALDYHFTIPYAESMLFLYTRRGRQIPFNRIEDLKGFTIGVTKGFANTPEFDRADFLQRIPFDTEQDSLAALIQGNLDLVVMDKFICLDLMNRIFPDQKDDVVPLDLPLDKKPLYLIFSKAKPGSLDLVRVFNKGLETIRENGLYDQILQRHRFLPIRAIDLVTLDWYPYSNSTRKDKGFVSDLIIRAYRIAGYEVNIVFRPWARALRETEFGVHDAAFPAYYSDERNQRYVLVPLNIRSELGFMKTSPAIPRNYGSLKDLAPYRIGVVHGYVNRPDFDRAEFLRKLSAYSDRDNFQRLLTDKLDLIVIDRIVAEYLAGETGYAKPLEFLSPLLDAKMLYLAFSRQATNLKKKITAFEYGYAELREEEKSSQ